MVPVNSSYLFVCGISSIQIMVRGNERSETYVLGIGVEVGKCSMMNQQREEVVVRKTGGAEGEAEIVRYIPHHHAAGCFYMGFAEELSCPE